MLKLGLVLQKSAGVFLNVNTREHPILCWGNRSLARGTLLNIGLPVICSHLGQSKIVIPLDQKPSYILFEELTPNQRRHYEKILSPVTDIFDSRQQ